MMRGADSDSAEPVGLCVFCPVVRSSERMWPAELFITFVCTLECTSAPACWDAHFGFSEICSDFTSSQFKDPVQAPADVRYMSNRTVMAAVEWGSPTVFTQQPGHASQLARSKPAPPAPFPRTSVMHGLCASPFHRAGFHPLSLMALLLQRPHFMAPSLARETQTIAHKL